MKDETIQVEVVINKTVDVDVDLFDVLNSINYLSNIKKWNMVGYILNNIKLSADGITEEQAKLIKGFLILQLDKFNKPLI